jgi:hypothetical protein
MDEPNSLIRQYRSNLAADFHRPGTRHQRHATGAVRDGKAKRPHYQGFSAQAGQLLRPTEPGCGASGKDHASQPRRQ